jgi:hypothetical protein
VWECCVGWACVGRAFVFVRRALGLVGKDLGSLVCSTHTAQSMPKYASSIYTGAGEWGTLTVWGLPGTCAELNPDLHPHTRALAQALPALPPLAASLIAGARVGDPLPV